MPPIKSRSTSRSCSEFKARAVSPLGRVAAQVLEADRESIEGKYFFAWDPLAAVALLHPDVIRSKRLHIDVLQDAPVEGRTAQTPGNPNADVALDADAARFRKLFLAAFKSRADPLVRAGPPGPALRKLL